MLTYLGIRRTMNGIRKLGQKDDPAVNAILQAAMSALYALSQKRRS